MLWKKQGKITKNMRHKNQVKEIMEGKNIK